MNPSAGHLRPNEIPKVGDLLLTKPPQMDGCGERVLRITKVEPRNPGIPAEQTTIWDWRFHVDFRGEEQVIPNHWIIRVVSPTEALAYESDA